MQSRGGIKIRSIAAEKTFKTASAAAALHCLRFFNYSNGAKIEKTCDKSCY